MFHAADGGCGLARALSEAHAAFFEQLERYTLADLIAAPEALLTKLTH